MLQLGHIVESKRGGGAWKPDSEYKNVGVIKSIATKTVKRIRKGEKRP